MRSLSNIVEHLRKLDRRTVRAATERRTRTATIALGVFSVSGSGVGWGSATALLVGAYLVGLVDAATAALLGAGLLGILVAIAVGNLLKLLVRRPRPYVAEGDIVPVGSRHVTFSFPSTHSFGAGTVVGIFAAAGSVLVLPALAWALVVGVARVVFGVHYPSDVVSGLILGWGLGIMWTLAALLPIARSILAMLS